MRCEPEGTRFLPRCSNDGAADGQRFLVTTFAIGGDVADDPAPNTPQINVVLNWFEELKQRVPTGGSR